MTPASLQPAAKPGFGCERARSEDAVHRRARLRSPQVAGELLRELGQVHVVRSGTPEDLRIRGPSQTLIPLRAVSGHANKVGSLAPQDIAPQLVDHGAAGLQLSR